jgi:hypothetical protein
MTPASRELFRRNLLRQLVQIRAFAAPAAVLRNGAQIEGFDVSIAVVTDEMQYLCDKGLAREESKLLSPEVKRWRLTAEGRDYVAQEGLE